MSVLDNPGHAALTGPHARFAERHGNALRYQPDVAPFVGMPDWSAASWADLAALIGPGGTVVLAGIDAPVPAGWTVTVEIPGVQLVLKPLSEGLRPGTSTPSAERFALKPPSEGLRPGTSTPSAERFALDIVTLDAVDVPEMLELVARTQPGPFLPRTVELGTYLGIKQDGRLVAMAGERMHPPGYTEVSAVCTDDAYRGQGLGSRLVLAVAAGIRDRGETPFLHAAASNTGAIRLYEQLGFRLRRKVTFLVVTSPTAKT